MRRKLGPVSFLNSYRFSETMATKNGREKASNRSSLWSEMCQPGPAILPVYLKVGEMVGERPEVVRQSRRRLVKCVDLALLPSLSPTNP